VKSLMLPLPPKRNKALAVRIFAYLFVVVFLLPGGAAYRWLHMPRLKPTTNPAEFGFFYYDVYFQAKDGVKLSGWAVYPTNYLNVDAPVYPPVVICHGIGGNREQMAANIGILVTGGVPAFAFDFRGHGESGGDVITVGYNERLDLDAAIDAAKAAFNAEKVFLWGLSMGAATSALVGPKRGDVAGMILESTFDNLANTINKHAGLYFRLPEYPFAPIIKFWIRLIAGVKIEDVSPIDSLAAITNNLPLLMIGSKEDFRMPPELVQRIFDAAATANKRIWIVDKGGHGGIMFANQEIYAQNALSFIYKYGK